MCLLEYSIKYVSPGALHLLLFTSPKIYPSTLWKEDLKQLEIFCRKFGLCDVYGCYLVYVTYFKFCLQVSLSISILLSLTVFFLLLAEIIPSTSMSVPLLG